MLGWTTIYRCPGHTLLFRKHRVVSIIYWIMRRSLGLWCSCRILCWLDVSIWISLWLFSAVRQLWTSDIRSSKCAVLGSDRYSGAASPTIQVIISKIKWKRRKVSKAWWLLIKKLGSPTNFSIRITLERIKLSSAVMRKTKLKRKCKIHNNNKNKEQVNKEIL